MQRRGESSILGQKLGPYFVSDRLGQGGMGAVYLAKDVALDRQVALKVLLSRYADDQEFVARFQREARACAKLNHPNIVQVYAVDIESDPAYIAMEYVHGVNLQSHIQRSGTLKWQEALSIVAQVGSALACAHADGIVHRDIKPANILLDKQKRVRVTDFGIAKIMGSQTNLTGTQHTVGSPCYMSPEQCGKGEVGPASDLFSLGIMLYEMLSGKVPFVAESSLAVMRRITDEDIPPIATLVDDIPAPVQQILTTLTARDPAFRYASANQLLEDLRALQAGGTMQHLQTLGLQRAAQEPATASAADLTRSPTGPSPALKSSLVEELVDAAPRTVTVARSSWVSELPWGGIVVTGMIFAIGILGMLYLKGWYESRSTQPVRSAVDRLPGMEGNDSVDLVSPPGPAPGFPRDGARPPLPPPEHRPPGDVGPRSGPRPGDPRRQGPGRLPPPQ